MLCILRSADSQNIYVPCTIALQLHASARSCIARTTPKTRSKFYINVPYNNIYPWTLGILRLLMGRAL